MVDEATIAEEVTPTGGRAFTGVPLAPGVAIGAAFPYEDIMQREREGREIDPSRVEAELERLRSALDEVAADLRETAAGVERDLSREMGDIFRAQEEILRDASLSREMEQILRNEHVAAENAARRVFGRWARRFQALPDPLFAERADDLLDLGRRILSMLEGIQAHLLEDLPPGSVVVARRLLPSDTVYLSRRRAVGVVVEEGGRGSHAALLTRELGIPSVGQVAGILGAVRTGQVLVVDGDVGQLIVEPSEEVRHAFEERLQVATVRRSAVQSRRHQPAVSRDGVRIPVMANVGCREDVEEALEQGAEGVGLYRVESLYLCHGKLPDEEELLGLMSSALAPLGELPATVRLLDLGGDKHLPFLSLDEEADPFLGRRGVRLLRAFPELCDTQLRALIRLARTRPLQILVPMVTLVEDMRWVRERLTKAAADLGLPGALRVGAMIETPAAALCAAELVAEADFLSVGTNDLTQYTLAAGRENPLVTDYFLDDHPAVLRLIDLAGRAAAGRPLSVCGELAAKEGAVASLLRAGVRMLSVAPTRIPAIKEAVREAEVAPV